MSRSNRRGNIELRRRHLRQVVAVALAIVLATACTAAHATTHSTGVAGDGHVTIVGDSLTLLGAPQIEDGLHQAGWLVTVAAYPGRTTGDQADWLRVAADRHNQATVVALGTNDALGLSRGHLTLDDARTAIVSALDRFTDQCVVWVIPDHDPERRGANRGSDIDAIVVGYAADHANVHVADMAAVLAAHPEYLGPDQVHLTDAGSGALADAMANSLAACR